MTGSGHTCATRTDGTLWCWGRADKGQTGDGTTTDRSTPGQVGTLATWTTLGTSHLDATCAATVDQEQRCWGDNASGQVGDGTTTNRTTPTALTGVSAPAGFGTPAAWAVADAEQTFSCGLRSDRTLWCWGDHDNGQGGSRGDLGPLPERAGGTVRFAALSVGSSHACAVTVDGALWCGGSDVTGEQGRGSTAYRRPWSQVGSTTTWATVSVGTLHSCATRTDGTLWCWGGNAFGQLGDGTTTIRTVPTQVGSLSTWAIVAAGAYRTCAIRTDASLWCWGANNLAQLGDGTATDRATPVQIGAGTSWVAASVGWSQACALASDRGLWCWGANWWGEVGDGTGTSRTTPTAVAGTAWASVDAGYAATCAARTDATLWCWGTNTTGGFGTGATSTSVATPVQVHAGEVAAPGAIGLANRCFRTLWAEVRCAGASREGQTGREAAVPTPRPVAIPAARWRN